LLIFMILQEARNDMILQKIVPLYQKLSQQILFNF
jgi:hypothetical protein